MKPIQLISPVDGRIYAERMPLSPEEARAACDRARAAQRDWAARPLDERIALVKSGVARLNDMADVVVQELAWQMGRPTRYGGEFGGVNARTDYMASIAAETLAPLMVEDSASFRRYLAREPVGVVFIIAPWNYPYLTTINTLVPALIAGNTVVLKHASQTLLVGERLAEAFHAAGIPEDVFQNLVLDHATTESLIQARAFNFINFTGSVAGGAAIERAAAGTFTGLGLELGGKDPGYVRADANLDAAVETLMDGAMFNAGQCCCGIERIYVHESQYDAFVDKAVAWANSLRLGNPFEAETTLGPMAHRRFAQVVRDQIAEAVAAGARPLIDPAAFPADDGGAYLAPQVLVNVDHSMRVMVEESFGPVVGIMKVASDDEAIGLMNDSPYGLTASIWTEDYDTAARIGARIQTGTVFMNRADYLDPALCWTGCKDTGRGTSLSYLGFHSVTRPKSYHLKKV
ncbi:MULTISPECIES: aldehyde dehydrogenase family protein [unclassified Paracoccus (in: a-proteobacteria)]|uniref:aldehyde dehydrogenase family protein n=1 Tax=unclassified Paracoccus (in: a-proteobacteria) TaxID=2688777 RepID=UPI0012B2112D|nr:MULTISPECIES: aldehyde dehydrogenase family protein [unclassified Paracoccus (in: a-proteobacteria)]UXU74398.1 aldehyde dehydrogenase family protein [Paracoccus sp. SMMA_5]UXU80288.1 aldehyde dehydrogenase family protein [Paracoccus sp. SMMA_5_TC]